MLSPPVVCYLLAALSVVFVLHFHLLAAVFAGLAVHVLTVKLAARLPKHWSGGAHAAALGAIVLGVILGLFGVGFGLWFSLRGHHGMAGLLTVVAETLEKLKRTLPAGMSSVLPDTVNDLKEQITTLLQEHGREISTAGMAGFKTFAHVLLGMIIGGMTVLHRFTGVDSWPPFAFELYARSKSLAEAFDKVVFAQVKISALNTVLTVFYLVIVLPVFGIHLPMVKILVPFTFVAGLIPVLGNLISNTLVVLVSLSVSLGVAGASLVFLILIHKLEYFTNARIIGAEVDARAWELLCAMLAMEAVFGVAGLVSAPVVYAWLKAELKAKQMI
jgi:predicted PurR-regulated permease PerM